MSQVGQAVDMSCRVYRDAARKGLHLEKKTVSQTLSRQTSCKKRKLRDSKVVEVHSMEMWFKLNSSGEMRVDFAASVCVTIINK